MAAELMAPALLVAAGALLLQGVFGVWSGILQVRNLRTSQVEQDVAVVVTVMQLIDGIPCGDGERAVLKRAVFTQGLRDRVPESVVKLLEAHGVK